MFYNFLTVAIRNAMRHKFYAIISLSSLAIGLTCAVLIMLSIRYEMSYDAFRPYADRVYRIMKRELNAHGRRGGFETHPYEWRGALPSELAVHLRDEYPEVEAVVQFRRITSWFRAEDRLFQQRLCPVDGDVVDFFGLDIIRGDVAALKRRDASVVLTQGVARKLYGNVDPIGRTVEVQRETYQQVFTVVAVMKDRPTNTRLEFDSVTFFASDNWAIRAAPIYVRLRPDADVEALERALAAHFPSESEATYHLQALPRIHLYSRIDLEGFTGDSGMPYRDIRDLYPLSVLGLGILLIACINFMNLATARSAIRAREIGLRKVVGARRQHIVGQLRQGRIFTRSAIVAVVLACLGLAGLAAFAAEQRTREIGIRKVLGASASHLVVLISQDFARLAVFASLIACPVGYFLMRDWLQNFAYQIDLAVWPFLLSIAVLLFIAVLTTGCLAWKTACANPVDILRCE